MGGQLRSQVVDDVVQSFHANCLLLIGDAYAYLRQNRIVNIDFDEEQISANIFVHIDNNPETAGFNIFIADECRQYCDDILNGKKTAKSASRIDLKFATNWTKQKKKFLFWVEAKNLIENDCYKGGRTSRLNADYLHRRYITTGIDNFVDGTYKQPGCLLGYVLEGQPLQIADKINALLRANGRVTEQLSNDPNRANFYFNSSHLNDLTLGHYWLDFT